MRAFTPIIHIFLHYSWFYVFFLSFPHFLYFLSFSFLLPFFSSSLVPILLCTSMAFYTACRDKICHFYPITTFGLLWGVLLGLPTGLLAAQPPPLHRVDTRPRSDQWNTTAAVSSFDHPPWRQLLHAHGPVGGPLSIVVCMVVRVEFQVLSLLVEEGRSTFGFMARIWTKF